MQGRNKNVSRSILAAAAVAVVGLSSATVSAQLQFGDIVTANSWTRTSSTGYLQRVDPVTGDRTTIGNNQYSWGWDIQPHGLHIEDANNVMVLTGNQHTTGVDRRAWRVNMPTGGALANANRSALSSSLFDGDWPNQPNDLERRPNASTGNDLYAGAQMVFNWQYERAGLWRMNNSNGSSQRLTTDYNWNWQYAPYDLSFTADGSQLYTINSWYGDSYNGYFYRVNPNTGQRTEISSYGWTQRPLAIDVASNGTIYAGLGTFYSSTWGRFGTLNPTNGSFTELVNFSNLQSEGFNTNMQVTSIEVDEENGGVLVAIGDLYDSGQTTRLYRYNTGTGAFTQLGGNLSWDETISDMKVYTFPAASFNNLTVAAADANSTTNGRYLYSTDSDGTVAASSVIAALTNNTGAIVRPGFGGSNNQLGDTTIDAALDFNTVGSKALTLRAANNLTVNQPISDSAPDANDVLAVTLIANQNASATNPGLVDVNAAITTGGGSFEARGRAFDNTGGAVTAGAVSISTTADTTIGSPIVGTTITVNAGGSTTISAAVQGTNVSITTNGVTVTQPITASGSFSLNNSGPTNITAPITAASLNLGSATLDVSSPITLSDSLGTSGTLNVLPGGTVTVPSLADSVPTVNIDGGTFAITGTTSLGNPGNFAFNSGTVSVAGNRTYSSSNNLAQRVMGNSVTTGKTVAIGGRLTLNSAYSIDGGTLKAGNLANVFNLTFTKGTLELTNSNIAVDSTGLFGDTLQLTSGQTVVASGASTGKVNVAADGLVEINGGRLIATAAVNNAGEIRITSSASRLGGSLLVNTGVLVGSAGRVEAEVINGDDNGPLIDGGDTDAIGEIRVGPGGNLRFTSSVTNLVDGRIEAQGGTVEMSAGAINSGRILISNGGNLRLKPSDWSLNPGSIEISGNANVYGDILNSDGSTDDHVGGTNNTNDGGKVIVSGGGVVNFFDDVRNGPGFTVPNPNFGVVGQPTADLPYLPGPNTPEFRISGGSAAVVFGTFSGGGAITGQGTLVTEGTLSLGDSPRVVSIEGNLMLGLTSNTIVELAGANPGIGGYDQLLVGGTATLGGTLDVVLLDGYRPAFGTQFEIVSAGELLGDFSSLNLPLGGEYWEISRTPAGLTLTAIPEPVALMGGAIVAAAALKRRARRDAR